MDNKDVNMFSAANMPKLDALEYPAIKCDACQNEIFVPAVMFRSIPGILLGASEQTVNVPIKVFVCSKCGELSPLDKQMLEEEKNSKQNSNLII